MKEHSKYNKVVRPNYDNNVLYILSSNLFFVTLSDSPHSSDGQTLNSAALATNSRLASLVHDGEF